MKTIKKILCLLLSVLMLLAFTSLAFAEESKGYTITNPYAGIDWTTTNVYKTALHTHTNASDGDPTLKESIERHVETGFDMVAITDHGTVNYSWQDENANALIHGVLSLVGKSEGELDYLGTDGSFDNGISYTLTKNTDGDDVLRLSTGKEVLRIPYGIENNAVSVNAHVNSWFVDYCDNTLTSYEDAVKGVNKAGGICVINHPGEYTKARYELHTEDAYNEEDESYAYYINKFAGLIYDYDTCLGIDMNSKGDARTRYDRKLWDILLTRFADNGKNVFGICSSDAHQLSKIDTGFTLLLADELTVSAAREALTNGEFFGASHCLGNYDELVQIADALKLYYGESDVYRKVNATAEAMADRVLKIENGEMDADEDVGIVYTVLDDDGYTTVKTFPSVTSIDVDDEKDTITVNTENALIVRFISNGRLITTCKAGSATVDLNDYEDELGNYVRIEVFGEGGMLYTQAYLLNAAENQNSYSVVKGVYFNLGKLDFLFADLRHWFNVISIFLKNII